MSQRRDALMIASITLVRQQAGRIRDTGIGADESHRLCQRRDCTLALHAINLQIAPALRACP